MHTQYLVASLILGQLHTIMSRKMYTHLCSILKLLDVNLPHWDTVRRMREGLRSMLKMEPKEAQSVLCNKTFSISIQSIVANVSPMHF